MPKLTQQQKDAVRLSILDTARHVFIEKGYEAASMKDIVTRSGRSFGGVYLYYSNKEDVFLDLVRRQYTEMASDFAPKQKMNAWKKFEYFMKSQQKRIYEADSGLAPCLYEYFIVGRREENRRKLIAERYDAVYEKIFTLIDDGIQQGELHSSQSVDTFVHWLISFLDGIFLESIISGTEKTAIANQFELMMNVCRMILMSNK